MSTTAKVTVAWGDGEYDFRLGLRELRDLQLATGVGPLQLLARIRGGDWRIDDLRETLRLGLMGALRPANEANLLVTRFVDNTDLYPLLGNVEPAVRVLNGVLMGWQIEPVGKPSDDEFDPDGKVGFAGLYGAAAVMGYSPRQVDEMSLWELHACLDGWAKAHGGGKPEAPSSDEFDAAVQADTERMAREAEGADPDGG